MMPTQPAAAATPAPSPVTVLGASSSTGSNFPPMFTLGSRLVTRPNSSTSGRARLVSSSSIVFISLAMPAFRLHDRAALGRFRALTGDGLRRANARAEDFRENVAPRSLRARTHLPATGCRRPFGSRRLQEAAEASRSSGSGQRRSIAPPGRDRPGTVSAAGTGSSPRTPRQRPARSRCGGAGCTLQRDPNGRGCRS